MTHCSTTPSSAPSQRSQPSHSRGQPSRTTMAAGTEPPAPSPLMRWPSPLGVAMEPSAASARRDAAAHRSGEPRRRVTTTSPWLSPPPPDEPQGAARRPFVARRRARPSPGAVSMAGEISCWPASSPSVRLCVRPWKKKRQLFVRAKTREKGNRPWDPPCMRFPPAHVFLLPCFWNKLEPHRMHGMQNQSHCMRHNFFTPYDQRKQNSITHNARIFCGHDPRNPLHGNLSTNQIVPHYFLIHDLLNMRYLFTSNLFCSSRVSFLIKSCTH
jgi:hypothetical protein